MDRLTTDNRETNLQTLLNYAYVKDRAVHLAFGNDEENIPLDEYIAHEARKHGCPMTATEVIEGGCMECDCPVAILNAVSIQAAELRARLMMIEDVLGDTYDLDHLRDLVQAEKEGRLKALRELEEQQRWIPVGERLPEESGEYLTYCGEYDGICILYCDVLKTKTKWRTRWKEVTYWMPLPEPPEEAANESDT